MKFGVCADVADAAPILAAGFDYLEVGASGFGAYDGTWDPAKYRELPILATNLFFDGRIKLFGQGKTPYRDYAEKTIDRAASLDIPVMVIGSGASRRDADGDQPFVDLVAELSEMAKPHGIALAPESLNRTETNVGNDLRSLALALRDRGVAYTADSYHVLFEWDADGRSLDLEDLYVEQVPFAPAHVHTADLSRVGVKAEDPMLQAFAARLRSLGYQGNVSLECTRGPEFDYRGAREALDRLFRP